MSSNIRSLSVARERRRTKESQYSYQEIATRITLLAAPLITSAELGFLHTIACFVYNGKPDLSYSFLTKATNSSRRSVCAYVEKLENFDLIRVVRSRISTKSNHPNHFAISFTGPLGGEMPSIRGRKTKNSGSAKSALHEILDGDNEGEKVNKTAKCNPHLVTQKSQQKVNKIRENFDDEESLVVQNLHCKDLKIKDRDKEIRDRDKEKKKEKEQTGATPSAVARVRGRESFSTINEAMSNVANRTADAAKRVAEKSAKADGGKLTMAIVRHEWQKAMLQYYPTVPALYFTAKSMAIFKQRMKPILATATLAEFFDYIVVSWEDIIRTRFEWLYRKNQTVSEAPSLPDLMRFFRIFAQSFAERKLQEAATRKVVEESESEAGQLRRELVAEKREAANARYEVLRLREKLYKTERMLFHKNSQQPPSPPPPAAPEVDLYDSTELPNWEDQA